MTYSFLVSISVNDGINFIFVKNNVCYFTQDNRAVACKK